MNKYAIGLIVVAIIAIGGYFTPVGKTVVNNLGAVSTLDGVDSPFTSIGGVEVNYVSVPITATSSTICSIPVPENATSTVLYWKVNIVDGILGANSMSLSTSTNGYATSAAFLILDRSVASDVGDSFSWQPFASTTSSRLVASNQSTGESPYFLLPGERLNLRLATTTGAGALGDYYDGTCSAGFLKQ
jgi:hypothetical protein